MNNQPKILKWSVIIGIIIVLNMFFNYALSLVYKQPDFNVFCPVSQVNEAITTQKQCTEIGGQWNANYYGKPVATGEVQPAGYCDPQFTCREAFGAAQKVYDRNIFIALVILGALSVLVGNFFKGNTVISNGLALGGVLSFIIASMRYWGSANDYVHIIILGIALAILFWIAMKKFMNQTNAGIQS